jgi:hypothetical protein
MLPVLLLALRIQRKKSWLSQMGMRLRLVAQGKKLDLLGPESTSTLVTSTIRMLKQHFS